MLTLVHRIRGFCLRRIKAALYPVIGSLVRRLSVRFMDDIVPLVRLEAAQARLEAAQAPLEAFCWDHVALARRLAALEDHVEKLSGQPPAGARRHDVARAEVPFVPGDDLREAGATSLRLQRTP